MPSISSSPVPRSRRTRQSGSVMVLFTFLLPTILIPLAGLAIDASIARLTQIRLQAAVDGAVLGAGRELGTAAVPETLAAEFLTANFRTDSSAGTWGAHNLVYNVVYTPGITKRIDVAATANVPLLFMRILGKTDATVGASGSATRSDSRVVFVIDRSGSMYTDDKTGTSTMVITDAINYTSGLVARFLEGSDELGLVVFDGSAVVGYPSGTWSPSISLASTGGPNKTFQDGTSNDMLHQLALIKAAYGTGMADAISLAYVELQKAHMRDYNADGVDTRLNSIVLLTDGVPSAISLYLNNPANSNADNIIKDSTGGSTCTNKDITSPVVPSVSNMMQSWISIGGSPPYTSSGGTSFGMFLMATHDTNAAHTAAWWMSQGNTNYPSVKAQDAVSPDTTPYGGGTCSGMLNNTSGSTTYNYFTKIPSADVWGNDMTGNDYKKSSISGNANATSVYRSAAGDLDSSKYTIDYHWGLAMWNAADSAAQRVRQDVNWANRTGDSATKMNIQFYVIGYNGNGGCDDGLLKRIANDKSADGYDSTQPTGRYYTASNGADLANAYQTLASDLLRLAR